MNTENITTLLEACDRNTLEKALELATKETAEALWEAMWFLSVGSYAEKTIEEFYRKNNLREYIDHELKHYESR